MKIQCDVCQNEVASLFCPADEASLCRACDHTIHHANKLAHQHKRFSLHHPNSKDTPLCDICHERRAYVFCKEDRAILCRECDLSIHGVNEHTKKHNRFLLTGIKIGAASSEPTLFSPNVTATGERTTSCSKINRPSSFSDQNLACDTGSVSTSSISEYLIQTIPGYCMEDLLDASFASNGFSKDYEHQSAFVREDVQGSMCSFPLQAWAPQSQLSTNSNILHLQFDALVGAMEMPKPKASEGYSDWMYDNDYAACKVPSVSPQLIKKCRRSR
ncbi:hypothetical protein Fmac_022429 [Flemingia macrophylla]|uniref:B box-type domain-containing protein n=1 Tax=Flemingia macrophylla TaxID=520843 RepID=A0ABD1LZQ2_9FABA